ncbi:MAG: CreA family protein [Pseudomonadota bacterium]
MSVRSIRPGSIFAFLAAVFLVVGSGPIQAAKADQVGEVDVDWLGNDIIIEAIADPKVQGVTCHLAYFERGLIDRFQKGNWFEDPSNSSISCRQTGPLKIGDIDMSEEGEQVFRERRSIILKTLRVKRVFDKNNNTLIYLAHAERVQNGSAKMSISTVPLYPNTLEQLKAAAN